MGRCRWVVKITIYCRNQWQPCLLLLNQNPIWHIHIYAYLFHCKCNQQSQKSSSQLTWQDEITDVTLTSHLKLKSHILPSPVLLKHLLNFLSSVFWQLRRKWQTASAISIDSHVHFIWYFSKSDNNKCVGYFIDFNLPRKYFKR